MPNVKLIDYTGCGDIDPWRAARLLIYAKNTRLTQGEGLMTKITAMSEPELMTELDFVANSVRSSWEFVSYSFQISDVTRAFTHQLVRTRFGVSFAQQAQRVVDMSEFSNRLPETVVDAGKSADWHSLMSRIAACYEDLRDAGVPAQDARGVLPTNVLTNIFARFDLRALADLLGKRDNLRAQDEYAEVARAMKAEVFAVHPWARLFIEPDRKSTPNLDALLAELVGTGSPVDKPRVNAALKELDKVKAVWG